MKRFDPAAALQKLSVLRKSMPRPSVKINYAATESRAIGHGLSPADAIEAFDLQALADSLDAMASELRSSIEEMHAKTLHDAMEVYYVAEELARDPENAHLIEHVEQMRRAYERDFGEPIPPR